MGKSSLFFEIDFALVRGKCPTLQAMTSFKIIGRTQFNDVKIKETVFDIDFNNLCQQKRDPFLSVNNVTIEQMLIPDCFSTIMVGYFKPSQGISGVKQTREISPKFLTMNMNYLDLMKNFIKLN